MAWTDPRNWTNNELMRDNYFISDVQDNMLETAPALVTTLGDLVVATGANALVRVAVGADDEVLIADAAETSGVRWGVAGGTTLQTEINAKGDLLVGAADNDAQRLAIGGDGAILQADAGEALGVRWGPVPWRAVLMDAFARNFGEMDVRGFWIAPELRDLCYDPSRSLTENGDIRGRQDESNPVGYWDLDGTGDYLSHVDHADFDVTGSMTWGGWFWSDGLATDSLLSKMGAAGNYSYRLRMNASGNAIGDVSGDGTVLVTVTSSNTIAANAWFFAVIRYQISTELQIDLNGTNTSNVTSIPASIFSGNGPLNVGAENGGTNPLDGRCSTSFIVVGLAVDAEIADYFDRTRFLFGV